MFFLSWQILLTVLLWSPTATNSLKSGYFYNIPGDYCESRIDKCCLNRMDDCSVPIMGTRCYCDEFCDRDNNPDCCPDYAVVCLGRTTPKPPPTTPKPTTKPPGDLTRCFIEGKYINNNETVYMDNCNPCICNGKDNTISCTPKNKCLVDADLLNSLPKSDPYGSGGLDWISTNYSMFWGKNLSDGMLYRTGTQNTITRLFPIHLTYNKQNIPESFDSRVEWPGLISRPRDQGWCASSWAFSTIAVATDRLAIETNGYETVMLSPQNMISCDSELQQGCKGGNLERAWYFLRNQGVVDEECDPYTSVSGLTGIQTCKVPKGHSDFSSIECDNKNEVSRRRREMLYRAEPAYRIKSRESDIQYEIMTNGPVQAKMRVEQDFFCYGGGVYSSSGLSDQQEIGYHSVRLIGWGEQTSNHNGKNIKYWLAANSWGEEWGEEGLFKIVRGSNESRIEEQILSVRMGLLVRYDPSFYPKSSHFFYQ